MTGLTGLLQPANFELRLIRGVAGGAPRDQTWWREAVGGFLDLDSDTGSGGGVEMIADGFGQNEDANCMALKAMSGQHPLV